MLWFIAAGSAAGGVTRYILGTLIINITGSLILGFVLRYALATPAISSEVRALLTTGFCGGYTTFSTFSYETVRLVQDGSYGKAATYVALSVGLAVLGTIVGVGLAGTVWQWRRS